MVCQKWKSASDGVDHSLGNLQAPAFHSDVIGNVVQVRLGPLRQAIRHQESAFFSAAKRARHRSITSFLSLAIDSGVISMPSPRSIEASASSRLARNSANAASR